LAADENRKGFVKTYTVDSKALYWLFVVGLPCFLVAFGGLWLWTVEHDPRSGRGVVWFGVVWMIAVLWGCYRQTVMPHSVEMTDRGAIQFVGAFRSFSVEPADVISVRAGSGPLIEIRFRRGKTYLLRYVTGFHEFLSELKQANPNVTVRGM
jgi:hypothetical protein